MDIVSRAFSPIELKRRLELFDISKMIEEHKVLYTAFYKLNEKQLDEYKVYGV